MKVAGHESVTFMTLDLFGKTTLQASDRRRPRPDVVRFITESVDVAIGNRLPHSVSLEDWQTARNRRAALELLNAPKFSRGNRPTSPVLWAYRAQVAASSAAPGAELADVFGASRRTVQGWLQQMTGKRLRIVDLNGREAIFLEASGPEKDPIYRSTELARTIASLR